MPDLTLETTEGAPHTIVAGVDEAGRGPLAGPVVAAACILPGSALAGDALPQSLASEIDDSKLLSPARREALLDPIMDSCSIGVGQATVDEIDRLNILQATFLAMRRALAALPIRPDIALVDGNRLPHDLICPARPIIGGDRRSLSIAAASVVAKVTRDREMRDLSLRFPGYGWERNMGYPTAEHRGAIDRLGPTPHHRRSFRHRAVPTATAPPSVTSKS